MDRVVSDIQDDEIGTPAQQEYWREARLTSPSISLVKASTAKPKLAVDPFAPVQLPEP